MAQVRKFALLSMVQLPSTGGAPLALFVANQVGTSWVDAASADGRYTFQVRVNVIASG
jgi:hypothetical protein